VESMEALARRISSAEDLRSIVRTMKALASASIRRSEEAARAVADYDRTVRLGLQAALRDVAPGERLAETEEARGRAVLAVVLGSDQGLCGPVNERVAGRALSELRARAGGLGAQRVVAVGARMAPLLEEAGARVGRRLPAAAGLAGVTPLASRLLLAVEEGRAGGAELDVTLYFARRVAAAGFEAHARRLLPLDRRWLAALRARPWPTRCLPDWPGPRADLLAVLVREYLFVSLFRAQVDALASEHASRLAAMQAAERNIDERLGELRALHRRVRQTAITSELMDVVSGFEALREEDEGP